MTRRRIASATCSSGQGVLEPRILMGLDLRKYAVALPTTFTLASVFCGFYAILECSAVGPSGVVSPASFQTAGVLIVLSMVFDVVDGRVARLTGTQSEFGMQMDSLADVMSFGIAPAVLVYHWSLHALRGWGVALAFTFVACSAIRLARFNVMTAQANTSEKSSPAKYIVGLPVPGAAGGVVAAVTAYYAFVTEGAPTAWWDNAWSTAVLVLFLSGLMLTTLPFRGFKDFNLSRAIVALMVLVFGSSALCIALGYPALALVIIIAAYIVVAFVEGVLHRFGTSL